MWIVLRRACPRKTGVKCTQILEKPLKQVFFEIFWLELSRWLEMARDGVGSGRPVGTDEMSRDDPVTVVTVSNGQ